MKLLREEFRFKNFFLDHHDPELHLSARWQRLYVASTWYLVYRIVIACYNLGWLIFIFIEENGLNSAFVNKFYFFLYLTNWSYLMLTVTTVAWAVNVSCAHYKYQKEGYRASVTGRALRFQWFTQNISFMPAFLVTTIYWVALYEPGQPIGPTNVATHLVNSVLVFVELVISATPIRLLHFWQPLGYLASYVIFSALYFVFGGKTFKGSTQIYSVLDWEDTGPTMAFIGGGALLALILYIGVWCVFLAREQIYKCTTKTGRRPSPQLPQHINAITDTELNAHDNPTFEVVDELNIGPETR